MFLKLIQLQNIWIWHKLWSNAKRFCQNIFWGGDWIERSLFCTNWTKRSLLSNLHGLLQREDLGKRCGTSTSSIVVTTTLASTMLLIAYKSYINSFEIFFLYNLQGRESEGLPHRKDVVIRRSRETWKWDFLDKNRLKHKDSDKGWEWEQGYKQKEKHWTVTATSIEEDVVIHYSRGIRIKTNSQCPWCKTETMTNTWIAESFYLWYNGEIIYNYTQSHEEWLNCIPLVLTGVHLSLYHIVCCPVWFPMLDIQSPRTPEIFSCLKLRTPEIFSCREHPRYLQDT